MAVYSGSVSVNNGNVNWTRAQVLQALETVFVDLGWHGAGESGILTGITAPANGWNQVGGTVSGLPAGFSYYLYEAPTSGGRKFGAFQVLRYGNDSGTNSGKVYQVNLVGRGGVGWTNNQAFTIPGTATGGTSPANDITFGTNAATIPSIQATASTFGSVSSWFDSDYNNATNTWAVLKCVNDAAKTYGTSYYSFNITSNYQMYIASGNSFNPVSDRFCGYGTLDIGSANNQLLDSNQGDFTSGYYKAVNLFQFATSVSPTQYPLTIRYWKANSPQDTNFTVISFVQSINGNTRSFGSFFLHKGTNFGSTIWDLNNVYQGAFTQIRGKETALPIYSDSNNEGIIMSTVSAAGYNTPNEEEPTSTTNYYSSMRESLYGYLRGDGYPYTVDKYDPANRYTTETNAAKFYFRDNTLDRRTENGITISMSSSANYYKVIKTIPVSNQLVPCPYYLPDDFVMVHFDTSPGLAEFYSGDTVTITAGSEVYTVIDYGYVQNQSSNSRTRGVLFCARTT
jgi:hypothetical protein